jgi:hypothetical protein
MKDYAVESFDACHHKLSSAAQKEFHFFSLSLSSLPQERILPDN